jgi:hypothetical protein
MLLIKLHTHIFVGKKLETHTFIFAIVVGNLGFVPKWTKNLGPIIIWLIVIIIGNPWIATIGNWIPTTKWAWNLGHILTWFTIAQNLWCVVVDPLPVYWPITHPHT